MFSNLEIFPKSSLLVWDFLKTHAVFGQGKIDAFYPPPIISPPSLPIPHQLCTILTIVL
jgi:hypothetical protein